MHHRQLLRSKIWKAWKSVIRGLYEKQRINSERSLQAALWASLNRRLPDANRMFIEPHLRLPGCNKTFIPDIVVCSRFRIAAIIELKYRPRGVAKYSKDLSTLEAIAQCSKSDFAIANIRFEGRKADERTYTLSPTTLLVWAGIHRPLSPDPFNKRALLCDEFDIPKAHFMQRHAETVRVVRPSIDYRSI